MSPNRAPGLEPAVRGHPVRRIFAFGKSWPRSRSYPLVGAALSLGAAAGFFALRCALTRSWPSLGTFAAELDARGETYAYIVLSAMLMLTLLGVLLGRADDKLQASATHDSLTGLRNRAFMHAQLKDELERTARYRTPLTLLLIDVDGLKQINDHGGHEAGDRALQAVAEALRSTCRASDVAGRYGGDEFVVLAPQTTADEAMELAVRLREVLSEMAVSLPGRSFEVCVSIGIVDADGSGDLRPEAMYAAADAALYEAKRAGRDRAKISSRPPPPPPPGDVE